MEKKKRFLKKTRRKSVDLNTGKDKQTEYRIKIIKYTYLNLMEPLPLVDKDRFYSELHPVDHSWWQSA